AGQAMRRARATVTRMRGTTMRHLAEDMWHERGHAEMLADTPWPVADPELARDEQVTIAVQVNGKLRATLDLPRDAAANEVEEAALALPQVTRLLDGKAPRKVVVVPNRIVSVVA